MHCIVNHCICAATIFISNMLRPFSDAGITDDQTLQVTMEQSSLFSAADAQPRRLSLQLSETHDNPFEDCLRELKNDRLLKGLQTTFKAFKSLEKAFPRALKHSLQKPLNII